MKTRESIESISNICLVEQIKRHHIPLIATRISLNRNEGGNMNWSYLPAKPRSHIPVICSIWMKLIFDLNEFKWTNRRWLISITLINSESTQQCQRTRAISIATTTSMQNKLKLMLSQNNRPWTNALMVSPYSYANSINYGDVCHILCLSTSAIMVIELFFARYKKNVHRTCFWLWTINRICRLMHAQLILMKWI